jgi:hypothetical protein
VPASAPRPWLNCGLLSSNDNSGEVGPRHPVDWTTGRGGRAPVLAGGYASLEGKAMRTAPPEFLVRQKDDVWQVLFFDGKKEHWLVDLPSEEEAKWFKSLCDSISLLVFGVAWRGLGPAFGTA